MRLLGMVAIAGALVAGGREELTAKYEVGNKLRMEQQEEFDGDLEEVVMTIGEEELPADDIEGVDDMSSSSVDRYVIVDEVLEEEDGEPTKVRRTFVEASREEEDQDGEREDTGLLEGVTLILSLDSDGDVVAEPEDDEELDEECLRHHRLARTVDLLLPEDEVGEGDSWEVEGEEAQLVLGFSKSPRMFEPEDEEDEEWEDWMQRLDENASTSIEVEFAGIEEKDGLRCALLELEATAESSVDELPESEEGLVGSLRMDFEFEGSFWFSLEEHRAVAFEAEVEGTLGIAYEGVVEEDGFELDFGSKIVLGIAGKLEATWTVADEEDGR